MENVDTLQFINMDVIGASDLRNAKDPLEDRGSQSEKLEKARENSSSNLAVPGVRLSMDASPSISSANITNATLDTVLSQMKPAFQMIAPEDLLELDDEHDAVDISVQSAVNKVKTDFKVAETEASISGMSVSDQPLLSSSKTIPFAEIDKAYDASHGSEKESSFRFPVANNTSGLFGSSSLCSSSSTSGSLFDSSPSKVFSVGLKSNASGVSSFVFGSSSRYSFCSLFGSSVSPFQFNSRQNSPNLQNPNPFQAAGNS